MKRNAKQTHNENDRTLRRGENLFTNNHRLTLHDAQCSLSTLTKWRRQEYISTIATYPPWAIRLLQVSLPFFMSTSGLIKGKQTPLLTTFASFASGCKTLLQPFRFPSGCSYSLSASVPLAAFLHRKCFPERPNKTPEAEASPWGQTHARSRSHMPEFSAHIRSHKQARSWRLSERQRKYHESIATTTRRAFGPHCKHQVFAIPQVIDDYNHYMNGVDQADQLCASYPTQLNASLGPSFIGL